MSYAKKTTPGSLVRLPGVVLPLGVRESAESALAHAGQMRPRSRTATLIR